ncbi:nuclear transport factor 2 family protein [Flagellimonas lutaonensis]|uniref:3-methyl-2-oxobutanoate hydroxymethyltransferase n=1 Tax=Flagellimonas lutaonensis TaxID=516051 RepID=A0A0D5YXG1_9FLAO|nr:nuclear transport factor 2 family protein [Allomuricauda lutaonensis]AKA36523.1 3-methyl-2-oxobutanoate hydroxymethyltransferase [Allomuricauda lutaonensis]
MKRYFTVALFFFFAFAMGQEAQPFEKDKMAVKKTIETFFEAFHAQDSVTLRNLVADDIVLQTTARNQEGKTIFRTQDFGAFLRSIVSIPDSVAFEEKLTSWSIQVDRTMANAWVGYEFWLNGNFSHCGINSFQLINFDGEWKIIYLIDTRGRAGCLEEE